MRQVIFFVVALIVLASSISHLFAQSSHGPERAVTPAIKDEHRHQEFLQRIKEGPVALLFLGDSITDGWRGDGKEVWKNFEKYRPANFGIGGDRTEHVLWRIENGELDGIDPRVTVIMIGTNNIGHVPPDEPAWAAAGVEKIVDTVHAKLPRTKILLLAVFPREGKDSERRKATEQINEHIKALGDRDYVEFLDINEVFLDENGEIPKDIMPDGLHPNTKGYELWYAAIEPKLEEMMR